MSRHLAVELLSSYMDEEVTPAQLRLVEGHLSACTDCRRTLAGLRAVVAGVRRLEAVAPPPALSAAVERRVRLASREESGRFRLEDGLKRWAGQPVLAPAFAIVLALGAILYLFAFGVSRSGRHTTRLVVATAPSEENTDSLGKDNQFRADSEAPAAKLPSTSEAKSPPVSESIAPDREPVRAARTRSVSDLLAKAATVAQAAEQVADRRQELNSKVEPVSPEVVEPAEPTRVAGLRREVRSPAATELENVPAVSEMAEVSLGNGASEVRELAGRTFVREGGIWVEVGLEGEPAAEVLDLHLVSVRLEVELSVFRDLGRVRLRIDDRVVEVIYGEAAPRD